MPATDDYDRQFEMQKMLLENQMKNNAMLMQQQLASALDRKRNLMDRITQSQIEGTNPCCSRGRSAATY